MQHLLTTKGNLRYNVAKVTSTIFYIIVDNKSIYSEYFEIEEGRMKYPVGKGWHQLIDKYISKIEEAAPGSKVTDIREKYGACVITVNCAISEKQNEVNRLTEQLEKESEHICELCGKPGEIIETENDWLKCLCNDCYNSINLTPQNPQYFLFNLEDCYTPGYYSSTKQYLGTEEDFFKILDRCPEKHKNPHLNETFRKFKEDKYVEYHAGQIMTRFAEPAEVLEIKEISGDECIFEFENTWSHIYQVQIEKYHITYYLVKSKSQFLICAKAELLNPRNIFKEPEFSIDTTLPLDSGFWGYPGVIVTEHTDNGYILQNQIYAAERRYTDEQEAREDFNKINEPLLQSFFEDVFGNG